MNTVRITYFGMAGEGRNVTEAKRDAGAKIERAMNGSYAPKVVSCGSYSAIVYRTPEGWESAMIRDPDGMRDDLCISYSPYQDEKTALQRAIRHVVDCGMDWRTMLSESDVPAIVTDKSDRSDLLRKAAFCRAYHHALSIGVEEGAVHNYACDHTTEWLSKPLEPRTAAA